MAAITLTPAGGSPLDLLSSNWKLTYEGTVESLLPVPVFDEAYAESVDTEGGQRIRTRPTNPTGGGSLRIKGTSTADLQANIATWEQTVYDTNKYGGALAYTPTSGTAITYDIESMRIASLPQDESAKRNLYSLSEFEFITLPYGRLAQAAVVTNANGTAPILSFNVPALDGSVDALGILTLTDTASQARSHAEGGMESTQYNPASPWSLLIDTTSMSALESATSTTRAASYSTNIWRQTLSTTSKGVAFANGTHLGSFRVKGRFFDSAGTVSVRLGYSIRGGGTTFNSWVVLPQNANWTEVDLGVVNIPPAITGTHSVTFSIYAKASTGTPTLDLDYLKLFPAENYFKANGTVGSVTTVRSGRYLSWRYNGVLTETATDVWSEHPSAVGSYLRIPRKGGRIAVALNRNNIDTAVHTPLADAMRADLTVIPRVALIGA